MNKIEIVEKGYGCIDIVQAVPSTMQQFVKPGANPLFFEGVQIKALLQEFTGKGFRAWYSKYWTCQPGSKPVIVSVRSSMAMLELRIARRKQIKGTWEKINNPSLPESFFHMGAVSHILTEAIFEQPILYETFDIHFDIHYLLSFGISYKTLDKFLHKIGMDGFADLSRRAYPCSDFMLGRIEEILDNPFSAAGRERMLEDNISSILMAALEKVGGDELERKPLSLTDIDALHYIRDLIDKHFPVYIGNPALVKKARPQINLYTLSYGFKELFHVNPHEYYLRKRNLKARELLKKGDTVESVAAELEYENSTTFIKAFKKRNNNQTPKRFQLYGD